MEQMKEIVTRVSREEADDLTSLAEGFDVTRTEIIRALIRFTTWDPTRMKQFRAWITAHKKQKNAR